MPWQDVVLAAANLVFMFSLGVMLASGEKPPLQASIPTGMALLACAAATMTLDLWVTAGLQGGMGLAWLTLAWQRSAR